MTDKMPVKGNCVESGLSLVADTLSCLIVRNLNDRLQCVKYYFIVSFNFPS